jgi:rhodanese-related sulfurtransferase
MYPTGIRDDFTITTGGALLLKNRLRVLATLALLTLLLCVGIPSGGCTATQGESPKPEQATMQAETQGQKVGFVTPKEAFNLIKTNRNNPDFVIIDDRQPSLFSSGHIANAINMPNGTDLKDRIGKLDRSKVYLISCRIGCGHTSNMMRQLGFREVYEMEGGLDAWTSLGLPIEK